MITSGQDRENANIPGHKLMRLAGALPGGWIVMESYNDGLIEQREARRRPVATAAGRAKSIL